VVAEPLHRRADIAGSDEFVAIFGRFFLTQWKRVVGAHQLVRQYEADHPEEGAYGLMVRLRTDTLFYRRFDFEYMAKEMSRLNPGREWLALPQGLQGNCRHCNVTSRNLTGVEKLTDMVAVGTPAAMDAYASPFDETYVDSLPLDTENYITLVMRKLFYFPGSAASGSGVYGGATSGDPISGFSSIPCARSSAAMEDYPVSLDRDLWPAATSKPQICNNPIAPFLLYHFRACGISMIRYKVHINDTVPFHPSKRGGIDSDVLHTWSDEPVHLSTACPVGVEPITPSTTTITTTSLGSGVEPRQSTNSLLSCSVRGRYSIPCSQVSLFGVEIPPMPAELRTLLRDRHAMKRECMRRLAVDPKFGDSLVGFSGKEARFARRNRLDCVGADFLRRFKPPEPTELDLKAEDLANKKSRTAGRTHSRTTTIRFTPDEQAIGVPERDRDGATYQRKTKKPQRSGYVPISQ
jgi:hypothetical protein